MNLKERYARLHDGVRFAIETTDDAYPLPRELHEQLQEWVLDAWEGRRSNIDWCDNRQDLVAVTSGLTRLAQSYTELRKALFSDLHHFGPEPPWRRIDHGFAVRLPLHFHRRNAEYYVLRSQGMNRWKFCVHGQARSESGEHESALREFDVELSGGSCRVPDELADQEAWQEQLFYGLRLMKDEHYYMRTLRDEVVMEAESIIRPPDDHWEI
ncbi:hypothetical protein [Nocardiopsis halotolerans]|uniref:hypothetical protein n=1 Tax=Nocardiopsis halotolerans TaxID=124252 RepID=UPI0003476123|nr:hypothetical protein [Nocardiopsis halotolerans]